MKLVKTQGICVNGPLSYSWTYLSSPGSGIVADKVVKDFRRQRSERIEVEHRLLVMTGQCIHEFITPAVTYTNHRKIKPVNNMALEGVEVYELPNPK